MIQTKKITVFLSLVLTFVLVSFGHGSDVSFEKDIKPILEKHCISCHGPEKEEGTRLDIREDALDYIEPEDAESSTLYEYLVTDDEDELMPPPDDENPLSQEQISLIETWINEGAEWPEGIELVDLREPMEDESTEPAPDDENPSDDASEKKSESEGFAKLMEDGTVWNAVGSLHPATLHIPIGLLVAAACLVSSAFAAIL